MKAIERGRRGDLISVTRWGRFVIVSIHCDMCGNLVYQARDDHGQVMFTRRFDDDVTLIRVSFLRRLLNRAIAWTKKDENMPELTK
mgnify:CR=1 FL=1